MKTTLILTPQSDFAADLMAAMLSLPGAVARRIGSLGCMMATGAASVLRWFRSDRGQFVLILLMALTVLSLQLRSLM